MYLYPNTVIHEAVVNQRTVTINCRVSFGGDGGGAFAPTWKALAPPLEIELFLL